MAAAHYTYVGREKSGKFRVQSTCKQSKLRLDLKCSFSAAGAWTADVFHVHIASSAGDKVRLWLEIKQSALIIPCHVNICMHCSHMCYLPATYTKACFFQVLGNKDLNFPKADSPISLYDCKGHDDPVSTLLDEKAALLALEAEMASAAPAAVLCDADVREELQQATARGLSKAQQALKKLATQTGGDRAASAGPSNSQGQVPVDSTGEATFSLTDDQGNDVGCEDIAVNVASVIGNLSAVKTHAEAASGHQTLQEAAHPGPCLPISPSSSTQPATPRMLAVTARDSTAHVDLADMPLSARKRQKTATHGPSSPALPHPNPSITEAQPVRVHGVEDGAGAVMKDKEGEGAQSHGNGNKEGHARGKQPDDNHIEDEVDEDNEEDEGFIRIERTMSESMDMDGVQDEDGGEAMAVEEEPASKMDVGGTHVKEEGMQGVEEMEGCVQTGAGVRVGPCGVNQPLQQYQPGAVHDQGMAFNQGLP